MSDAIVVGILCFVSGVLITSQLVRIGFNERIERLLEVRAKLLRECRILRWQLCGMSMTLYASKMEAINQRLYFKCIDFRDSCAIQITSEKISEDMVKDLIITWSKKHERWKRALKKMSKLPFEKNQEIFKAMDKYNELVKQYFYQLST